MGPVGTESAVLRIVLEGDESAATGSSATSSGGGALVSQRTGEMTPVQRRGNWSEANQTSDVRDERETGRGRRRDPWNLLSTQMMLQMTGTAAANAGMAAINPQAHGMSAVQSILGLAAVAGRGTPLGAAAGVTGIIAGGLSAMGVASSHRADELSRYDPRIMSAKVMEEVRHMMREMREARSLGGDYAASLAADTRLNDAMERWMPAKKAGVKVGTAAKEGGASALDWIWENFFEFPLDPKAHKERLQADANATARHNRLFAELAVEDAYWKKREADAKAKGGELSDDEKWFREEILGGLRKEIHQMAEWRNGIARGHIKPVFDAQGNQSPEKPEVPPNIRMFFEDPPIRPELMGPQLPAGDFVDQILNRPAFQGRN